MGPDEGDAMTGILTTAQMREVERRAFAAGVSSLRLMERAGEETLAAILAHWPELAEGRHHAVILCGPGNNGGDGYVVARRLADRGWRVEVLGMGQAADMPPDARRNRELWEARRPVRPATGQSGKDGDRPDLMVDALFGIGLSRPLSDDLVAMRHAVPRRPGGARCRIAAVDCLSGLDGDTGRVLGLDAPDDDADDAAHDSWAEDLRRRAMPVGLTVTGHAAKLGHYLGMGPSVSGTLAVRDIGIGPHDEAETPPMARPRGDRVRLVDSRFAGRDWVRTWLAPLVVPHGHKYDRGHVVVLSGGPGKGGAARMAARAALRTGAGLVTLACPPGALQENAARLDAVMTRPLRDADALAGMLGDDRLSGVVMGPGLGTGEGTRALVLAALSSDAGGDHGTATTPGPDRRAVILDADALTAFADDPDALFRHLHPRCVLTPHEGEFGRLFPDLADEAAHGNRVAAARAAADRAGCTLLLKGEATVIASPGGAASLHAALYDRAAPWLATAGAGDTLAGMIGALAGRPWRPDVHVAAEAAAWLHVEAARAFGPGLIAEDIADAIPGVYRALGF